MKFFFVVFFWCVGFVSQAEAFSFTSEPQDKSLPLEINAQKGMVCSQDKKRCTAFGSDKAPVVAMRGTSRLACEKLVVYFKDARADSKSEDAIQQDIEKIETFGSVNFSDTKGGFKATSQYGIYRASKGQLSLQGNPVLKEGDMTVLAGSEVIFYEQAHMAVTLGRSTLKRGDKLMQADTFRVYFVGGQSGKLIFERLEAQGNVVISTPTEIAKANRGIYRSQTQVAELFDNVILTRKDGQLRGDYGRYDMATGKSQLFNRYGKKTGGQQVQAILSPVALKKTKEDK